uniref:Uncharacterized protein n=1 Tax=Oryza glumipatula TaxID=40148 RepID=A0A0E0ALM6_9ORYZ
MASGAGGVISLAAARRHRLSFPSPLMKSGARVEVADGKQWPSLSSLPRAGIAPPPSLTLVPAPSCAALAPSRPDWDGARRPRRIKEEAAAPGEEVAQVVTSIVSAARLHFPLAADAHLSPLSPPFSLSLPSTATARAMRRANAAAGATPLPVADNA